MLRSVRGVLATHLGGFGLSSLRTYTVAAAATTTSAPSAAVPSVRDTVKPLASRKTYLVDIYTHYLRTSPVVLVLHNSTLLKNEDQAFRREVQKAGAQFTVIRSSLFKVALRGLKHDDPASRAAQRKFKRTKHPLASMVTGPTAIVTIPSVDPTIVDKVVSLVDKTNSRLVLLGGQVDGSLISRPGVDALRKLPGIEQLRAELAGVLTVLGGAGLVQTLEASSKLLYLTLDQHRKGNTEESEDQGQTEGQ